MAPLGRDGVGIRRAEVEVDGARPERDEIGEGHPVEGAGDGVPDADPQEVDGAGRGPVTRRG